MTRSEPIEVTCIEVAIAEIRQALESGEDRRIIVITRRGCVEHVRSGVLDRAVFNRHRRPHIDGDPADGVESE